MLKVSVSGIRGIWGESLTHEVLLDYVKSFVKIIGINKKIVIASDTRKTRDIIKNFLLGILQSYGYEIIDLGIVPTPLALYAVKKLNLDAGIMISASHNPAQWNALKLISKGGFFFNSDLIEQLESIYKSKDFLDYNHKMTGSYQKYNTILDDYIKDASKIIDIKSIQNHKFKVVVDAVNGTAVSFAKTLFDYLNVEYSILFDDINKEFERGAEPLPQNLDALKKKVSLEKADLGLAYDPDADRLALVSDKAEAVGEDWTLALAYMNYLQKEKTDIAINLSTSMLIDIIAKKNNKQSIKAKVGEINVTEKMLEKNLIIGGEGNGGVIYRKINNCRDSLIATLMVLEYLAKTGKKLSEITKEYPKLYFLKEKVASDGIFDKEKVINTLRECLKANNLQISDENTEDGIRVDYSSGWIQVRASNTEPILRIMGESTEEKNNKVLFESLKSLF